MFRCIKACLYRNGIDQPVEFLVVVLLAIAGVALMLAGI